MPLDGQWPPVHASDYVPLILSLSDFNNEQALTSKIHKILKGEVHHLTKNLISFDEIFKPDGEDDDINSILIQGSPGIGKTAFSLTVCKKWASSNSFGQFSIVILWALRDPQVASFTSVDDLFFHDSKEVSEAVVREVKHSGGKGVLFVLDGWDELPPNFTESRSSCFFLKLVDGKELPFSSVIVTSRNVSSQTFLRQNSFNRTIDILGFSSDCVQQYIERCFSKAPQDREQLLQQLKERPDIQSICYVPMNCSIVCYVYSCKKTLPSTLTDLYSLLAKNSLIRNVDLRSVELKEADFEHLPDAVNKLYLSLCKLSYHGLIISRYTYSREDVAAACEASSDIIVDADKLGVLQAVNVFHSEGVTSSFHFLHSTVQEFMAASYIASLNEKDLLTVVRSHFSRLSFEMVWEFYCGLAAKNGRITKNKFIERLQMKTKEAANSDAGFHDRFSYTSSYEDLYFSESDSESGSSEHSEEILSEHEEEISDRDDSVTDEEPQNLSELQSCPSNNIQPLSVLTTVAAVASVSDASQPSMQLDLPPSTTLSGASESIPSSQVLVTRGGLEGVPTTMSNATATKVGFVNSYKSDKEQVLFTLRCVYETQNRTLCTSVHNILTANLYFDKFSLSPSEVNAIGYTIARSNRKWKLNLANCEINASHLMLLSHHFSEGNCTGKLTRLYLNNNELDYSCVVQLTKMLPILRPLQKLFLGRNNLGDECFEASAVPALLKGTPSLQCLELASTNIGDAAVESLMNHTSKNIKHLTHLDISNNSISRASCDILAASVLTGSNLKHLDIGGNPLKDEGIQALCDYLGDSSLSYLNVSETGMTDEGLVVLATALPSVSTLQTLIIHSNIAISSDGLGFLLEMSTSSTLCEIDASYCQTGYTASLSDVFKACTKASATLKSLDVSYNELEDEGVSTLLLSLSPDSSVTRLAFGGNAVSASSLQVLGCVVCESNSLEKISLNEEDLSWETDDFDSFCECLVASSSLQEIRICAAENEQTLRKLFREVNHQRVTYNKSKLKFHYFN